MRVAVYHSLVNDINDNIRRGVTIGSNLLTAEGKSNLQKSLEALGMLPGEHFGF